MDVVIQQLNNSTNSGCAIPPWAFVVIAVVCCGILLLIAFLDSTEGMAVIGGLLVVLILAVPCIVGYDSSKTPEYPYSSDIRQQLSSAIESEYKLAIDTSKDDTKGLTSSYTISDGLDDIKTQLKNEHTPLKGINVKSMSSSSTGESYKVYIVNNGTIWNLCARNSNGEYVVLDKGGNAINQLKGLG